MALSTGFLSPDKEGQTSKMNLSERGASSDSVDFSDQENGLIWIYMSKMRVMRPLRFITSHNAVSGQLLANYHAKTHGLNEIAVAIILAKYR